MSHDDLVFRLDDVGSGDRRIVGGKGASLGELRRAGFPVPAGFAVTACAFERAMQVIDPAARSTCELDRLPAGDSAAIAAATARMRDRIRTAPLPADIAQAITASLHDLVAASGQEADDIPVAVRSSATSEDSLAASFAGLQDSYLWIRGPEAVRDSVRRCWASLYNAEAVSYRLRQGIGADGLAMGVVVQCMVNPRAAGVMFTCSPTTGDRSVVAIEASWGLGSVLVSGKVTPDRFVVSKVTGEIVRRTVSVKQRLHRPDPAGSGTVADDVPRHLRDQACLDDQQIRALAEVARRVERHYGATQDIEWALTEPAGAADSDVGIVLLQSRPETAWAARSGEPLAVPRPRAVDHVFEHLGRVVPVARPER